MIVAKNISWQVVLETVFIFFEDKGEILKLENEASKIWLLAIANKSVSDIVEILQIIYDVEYSEVYTDVCDFLSTLKDKGIITEV